MADKSRKGHVLGYFPKSDKLCSLKFEHLVKDNGFINNPLKIGDNGDIDYGPGGLHNFYVIRVFSGNLSLLIKFRKLIMKWLLEKRQRC